MSKSDKNRPKRFYACKIFRTRRPLAEISGGRPVTNYPDCQQNPGQQTEPCRAHINGSPWYIPLTRCLFVDIRVRSVERFLPGQRRSCAERSRVWGTTNFRYLNYSVIRRRLWVSPTPPTIIRYTAMRRGSNRLIFFGRPRSGIRKVIAVEIRGTRATAAERIK